MFACAFAGLLVGCLLHAIPATSTFRYSDVIALDVASLTAAAMTSFWVYKSPPADQGKSLESVSELNPGRYHSQIRIGATRAQSTFPEGLKFVEDAKYTISAVDNSVISQGITGLLQFALDLPNNFSSLAPWSSTLLRRTIDMWCSGNLAINVSSRQHFLAKGLQDSWSISDFDENFLQITAGFLDEAELESYRDAHPQALSYLLVHLFT